MASHDIDGTATRELDPGFGKKRAAMAAPVDATDETELAAEERDKRKEKKKAASSRKARRAKPDKPELPEGDEEAGDGSHPRPDRETILRLLWEVFAVSPEVAAAALNVSRNSGYAAIHKGDIPATRVGNRLMVPTAYLRQRLYLEPPMPGSPPVSLIVPKSTPAKPNRVNRKARASSRRQVDK